MYFPPRVAIRARPLFLETAVAEITARHCSEARGIDLPTTATLSRDDVCSLLSGLAASPAGSERRTLFTRFLRATAEPR